MKVIYRSIMREIERRLCEASEQDRVVVRIELTPSEWHELVREKGYDLIGRSVFHVVQPPLRSEIQCQYWNDAKGGVSSTHVRPPVEVVRK